MTFLQQTKSITFETKVWEKDWRFILEGDYLEKLIENCDYEFNNRQIIINNVKNRSQVEKECSLLLKRGVITDYYSVEDYEIEVLDFFRLTKQELGEGYVYSIAELVGIYLNKNEYLLHFSGDSFVKKNTISWIAEALDIIEKNPDIIVANPTWNSKFEEAKSESDLSIGNFFIGYGFSDQCYLIVNKVFKDQIYNFTHTKSERYPAYGGELFEKRVDAFMRTHGLKRATSKSVTYYSKNYPKGALAILIHKLLSIPRL